MSTLKQFGAALLCYVLLRAVTFIFPPGNFFNSTLTILYLLLTAYYLLKRNTLGWYLVTGELILGGAGGFLQAFSITLRSYLLILSLSIFFVQEWETIVWRTREKTSLLVLLAVAGLGFMHGYLAGHNLQIMFGTAIPYLFLLYYFPLQKLLRNESWKMFCLAALQAAVLGQALFIYFTFTGFATGYFALQDTYYHWFRDIAGGKITWVAYDFYRIVLNEQLLLVPLLLYYLHQTIHKKSLIPQIFAALLLYVFAINLTRSYMIALFIGIIALFSRAVWRQWLATSLAALAGFFILFSCLYLAASGGHSFGLEVFGLRLQSIVAPHIEDSALSRVFLLPKVVTLMASAPLIGTGLGTLVTVYSPVVKQTISTNQFDWGYLQIIAELGAVGFLVWMFFLWNIFKKIKPTASWPLASFGALLVINVTSPALFHVLGIVWLTFLLARSDDVSRE